MNAVTFWSLALPAMLAGCVVLYRQIRRDESPEAQREAARDRVMMESADDDLRCHCCHRVTLVRRLVMLYDDAALMCEGCASLTMYNHQERAA
jgi:hypothetical protein